MTVVELALLRVEDARLFRTSAFTHKLKIAKAEMDAFTGFQFTYYQQMEDPTRFYILGAWESVDQHRNEWIPSRANEDLLQLLKDDVQLDWLVHVNNSNPASLLSSAVDTIERVFVGEESDGFNVDHQGNDNMLKVGRRFVSFGEVVDGATSDSKEYVIFRGWPALSNEDTSSTEAAQWAQPATDGSSTVELKHVRRIEL